MTPDAAALIRAQYPNNRAGRRACAKHLQRVRTRDRLKTIRTEMRRAYREIDLSVRRSPRLGVRLHIQRVLAFAGLVGLLLSKARAR